MKIGDIVVVIVDHVAGVSKETYNPEGRCGIIIMIDGGGCVWLNDGFVYKKDELRLMAETEKQKLLIALGIKYLTDSDCLISLKEEN